MSDFIAKKKPHAPGAGSTTRPIDPKLSILPLYYAYHRQYFTISSNLKYPGIRIHKNKKPPYNAGKKNTPIPVAYL